MTGKIPTVQRDSLTGMMTRQCACFWLGWLIEEHDFEGGVFDSAEQRSKAIDTYVNLKATQDMQGGFSWSVLEKLVERYTNTTGDNNG